MNNIIPGKGGEVDYLDQTDQGKVAGAGTPPGGQAASVPANAGQAPSAMISTNAPQQSPGPRKSRTVLIAIAAIVVIIVIVTALILMGDGGTSNGASNGATNNGSMAGQIRDGSYMNYTGIGTMSTGQTLTGTIAISFSNMTSTSYTMTESITINGHSTTLSQSVNKSTGSWINLASGTNGTTGSKTLVGQESLQTNFGEKTTNHYTTSFSGYKFDYWEDASSQILYKMQFTYTTGGTFICTLTSTNMT
jgi:hypothetical protein